MPASAALLALAFAVAPGTGLAGARVTPSGPAVAENLLRIELHLDRPLAAPLDMQHVVLFDGAGAPVRDAFLDLPLSDRSGRTITLLLHPGRIKSGVGPNVALGPALRSGQSVTLRIDDPQLGRPLAQRWLVTAPLRQRIDPGQWQVLAVRRGGRQPLRVIAPAALDGAAARQIAIQGPDGRRLPGTATFADGEREWRFTPTRRWRPGAYLLRIHPRLEDPQGNRLCSAFEQAGQSAQLCQDEGRVAFVIE
ncbi:hypothetical protein ASC94_19730 [Massilia sp. Root418]|uniref:hypothetical protein n=1 Tax=Massilia sp. Root418 TaxID=1736532 RepID=UPI000701EF57|nr:hypothetical protein [Massilia sp. Root418]KQW89984.1 hypothetical protein ASC94_19730 [Massilia sp. Root418]